MMGVIGLGLAGQGPWLATLVLAQPAVHAFWYVRPSAPHTSEPVVGQVQSLGPVHPHVRHECIHRSVVARQALLPAFLHPKHAVMLCKTHRACT